jgi:hypothetical protein
MFQTEKIAEVTSTEVNVSDAQAFLELIMDAVDQGAANIILYEKNLHPSFFDLRSGLAGEILQKCVNYHVKLAIIGEFEKFNSKSLQALILESNRGKQTCFVPDVETAIAKLTG